MYKHEIFIGYQALYGSTHLTPKLRIRKAKKCSNIDISKNEYFTDHSIKCSSVKYRIRCKIRTRSRDDTNICGWSWHWASFKWFDWYNWQQRFIRKRPEHRFLENLDVLLINRGSEVFWKFNNRAVLIKRGARNQQLKLKDFLRTVAKLS